MAELRAWLGGVRDIAIQVRTGKAETGKTRLAFELCDELQRGGEWQAGFVNGEQLANLVGDVGARWGWDQPTLAVVDYAAERADTLWRWFGQLADLAPVDGKPLRILLLERQADARSGWLRTALGTGDARGADRPSDARPGGAGRPARPGLPRRAAGRARQLFRQDRERNPHTAGG
jgi:hypothetical protein